MYRLARLTVIPFQTASEHLIAQIGAERGIGDNMDVAAKQILQILLDGDEVEEAAAGLEREQQVELAAGVRLTAGRRAEDADGPSPALSHEPSGASEPNRDTSYSTDRQ